MAHSSSGLLRLTALGLALGGVLFMVVLAPRLFGLEEKSWWVTVAIGVVIGAAVVVAGYAKRDSGESRVEQPEE